MKKSQIILVSIGFIVLLVIVGLGWGVNYLFNYAIVPSEKDFINNQDHGDPALAETWEGELGAPEMVSLVARDKAKLSAAYFTQKQEGTPKLVVIAHGYSGQSAEMKSQARMFYDMGYDLLIPDARAHGKSEGEYIGFGWLERLDYVDWLEQMVARYQGEVEIVLYGVSMGGATVMMTSGEKLPTQVKAIIEDCGYDSVKNQLAYQLKEMFHLPAFPLVPLASIYTDFRAGYNFYEASAVKQLAKNHLPTLFIHGDIDDFVPTSMVYNNYEATKGPKELVIVEGAKHAESYKVNPEKYQEIVSNFLAPYIK